MWFRIETEKDGTVRSCEQVEGSFRNSGHVFYVEADSKSLALGRVRGFLESRERRNARLRDKKRDRRTLGLCVDCGTQETGGFVKCAKHRAQDRDQEKRRAKGQTSPAVLLPASERLAAKDARARVQNKIRKRTMEDNAVLRTLVLMRSVYSEDPVNFMKWLNDEIAMVEGRIGAKVARIRVVASQAVHSTAAE